MQAGRVEGKVWDVLVLLALFLAPVQTCVVLYGARHEVPHYGYGFVGLDWPEEFATCTGTRQSPIQIPGHSSFSKVPDGQETYMGYGQVASNGSNIKVVNNGHTVQVVFPAGYAPNASIVVRGDASTMKLTTKFNTTQGTAQRVKLSPAQFHFHTRSEHLVDGKDYAMEMHIVNWVYAPDVPACGSGGCATVVGVVFELTDDASLSNDFLETIWAVMPESEGDFAYIPADKSLDFDEILPADRSYITYEGSLTTPPCTEGILWHLLTTPMKVTKDQLHNFELAVGATQCQTHVDTPANRHLLSSSSSSGGASSSSSSSGGATTAAETFEIPSYAADPKDGIMCRKLAGQNYREVQDRQSRPIWFYPAPGLCDPQLNILHSRSKVLKALIAEANSSDSITLHQYNDIVEAGLTKSAGCAGITSGAAQPIMSAVAIFMQALLASMLLAWL